MARKARRPVALEALEPRHLLAVIPVSPGGESIQSALNRAQPGDTIELAAGHYYQDVVTVRSGRAGAPITIHGTADAVLHGSGGARVFQVHHDYITLDGFTLDGLAGDPNRAEGYRDKLLYAIGTSPRDGVEHLRVLRMTFRNSGGEALRLRYYAKNNEVAYSHFENTGVHDFRFGAGGKNGEAIYIGTSNNQWADGKNPTAEPDPSSNNWVHHNTFNTRGNEAVDIKEGAHANLVEYNTVTGQLDTESGGLDSRGDNNTFRYNTVYGNLGAGIRLGGALVNGHQYGQGNHVYGNTIRDNANGGIKFMVSPQGTVRGNTMSGNTGGNSVGSFGNQFDPTAGQPPNPDPPPDPDPDPDPKPDPLSGRLAPVSVTAQSDDGNQPGNVVDGDLGTRWSALGMGQWIKFDLGAVRLLEAVDIAFYQGTKRVANFELEVSTDGLNWQRVLKAASSGQSNLLQRFDFPDVTARYVRFVGGGNSASAWNSLTEVDFRGRSVQAPPDPDPPTGSGTLVPAAVTAQSHDGNLPSNVLDGNLATRWSAQGNGQWIQFDLGTLRLLEAVEIAFHKGTDRKAYLDIEVSQEGGPWVQVARVASSGTSDGMQRFDFADVAARYVRLVGRGNSINTWNSLTEVDLVGRATGPVATPQVTPVDAPTGPVAMPASLAGSPPAETPSTAASLAPVQPVPTAAVSLAAGPSNLAVAAARAAWESLWSAPTNWTSPRSFSRGF